MRMMERGADCGLLQERLTAKEAMAHAYFEPVRRNEVNDLQNNAAHQ